MTNGSLKMTDLLNVTTTKSRLNRQTEKFANERARTAMNAGARFWLIDLSGVDMVSGSL
jgi:anti-anti-sigma regulatory factor